MQGMDYYQKITLSIDAHHRVGQTVILRSDAGTGKTAFTHSLRDRETAKHGEEQWPITGLTKLATNAMDSGDLLGIPSLRDFLYGETKYHLTEFATPAWAYEAATSGGIHYVFFDEFGRTDIDVQGVLLNIIEDRTLPNGFALPDTVRFICATNNAETEKGIYDMPAAMTSRLAHYDFNPDAESWLNGLVSGFGKPLAENHARWRSIVASYLRSNPSAITDTAKSDRTRGWANRRTWTHLSDVLAELPDDLTDSSTTFQFDAVVAVVGRDNAAAFVAHVKDLSIPAPQDLLRNPSLLDNATDDIAFASLSNTAMYCRHTETAERARMIASGASEAEARNTLRSRTEGPFLSLINVLNYAGGEHTDTCGAVLTTYIHEMVAFCGTSILGKSKGKRPTVDRSQYATIISAVEMAKNLLD